MASRSPDHEEEAVQGEPWPKKLRADSPAPSDMIGQRSPGCASPLIYPPVSQLAVFHTPLILQAAHVSFPTKI